MTKAKIIHLCFGLSVCCLASEGLNVTLVNPGENISISCDNDTAEVYWYMQRTGRPPVPILRTFGGASAAAYYYSTGLESKYSLQTGNRLFIHNFTREDCATYYCAVFRTIIRFFDGTRLNVTDVVARRQNLTCGTQEEQRSEIFHNSVVIATVVLNFVFIVMILILTKKLCTALNCELVQKSKVPQEDITYCVMQGSERQNASSHEITACNETRPPTV